MSNEKLQEAISFYNSGDKTQATKLLREIVHQEPDNSDAWYGLALCSNEVSKKVYCLKRVLAIAPANQKAQQFLAKLEKLEYSSNSSTLADNKKVNAITAPNKIKMDDVTAGFIGWVGLSNIIAFLLAFLFLWKGSDTLLRGEILFSLMSRLLTLVIILVLFAKKEVGVAIGIAVAFRTNFVLWSMILLFLYGFKMYTTLLGYPSLLLLSGFPLPFGLLILLIHF